MALLKHTKPENIAILASMETTKPRGQSKVRQHVCDSCGHSGFYVEASTKGGALFCPSCSEELKAVGTTGTITANKLKTVAECPSCSSKLFSNDFLESSASSGKIHCITCGEVVPLANQSPTPSPTLGGNGSAYEDGGLQQTPLADPTDNDPLSNILDGEESEDDLDLSGDDDDDLGLSSDDEDGEDDLEAGDLSFLDSITSGSEEDDFSGEADDFSMSEDEEGTEDPEAMGDPMAEPNMQEDPGSLLLPEEEAAINEHINNSNYNAAQSAGYGYDDMDNTKLPIAASTTKLNLFAPVRDLLFSTEGSTTLTPIQNGQSTDWMIIHNGVIVASVCSQQAPHELKQIVASVETFPSVLNTAIENEGGLTDGVMERFNIRPATIEVEVPDLIAALVDEATQQVNEEADKRVEAELNKAALALEASMFGIVNGVVRRNDPSANITDILASHLQPYVRNPEAIAVSVLTASMDQFLDAVLDSTEELSNKPDEALKQTADLVDKAKSSYKPSEISPIPTEPQQTMPIAASTKPSPSRGNLPFASAFGKTITASTADRGSVFRKGPRPTVS